MKHKIYSLINVLGLALGIACCITIFNYVHNELNYDTFHKDHERIYRIEFYRESFVGNFFSNSTPGPVIPMLSETTQIEKMARLIPPFENSLNVLIKTENTHFFETDIYFADPEILDIFTFNFLKGSPQTSLTEPNTVIINRSMATKFFGEEDPIGKSLNIEIDYDYYCPVVQENFIVCAVIEDSPSNTHCPINMLLSMETMKKHLPWIDEHFMDMHHKYSFIKTIPNADMSVILTSLESVKGIYYEAYQKRTGREWNKSEFYLQPITNIHKDKNVKYKIRPAINNYYIKIYSIIAFVVLLIGCLNFINISISIATRNIKQAGIRKIIGANKTQLALQSFTESGIVTAISFVFGLCLVELFLPLFSNISGVKLNTFGLLQIPVFLSMIGLFLIITFISGGYNALILSSFKSSNIIKGGFLPGTKGVVFQRILIVSQFTIILVLIASSFVIYQQLNFMRGSSLGFDKDHKIVIPFKSNLSKLRTDYENIKAEFTSNPDISGATVTSGVPGSMKGGYYLTSTEIPEDQAESKWFRVLTCDMDFIEEFKIKLIAGRKFENKSDIAGGYIINEAGVKLLGFNSPAEAIGKNFLSHYHRKTKSIIGVVKDFHFKGMQDAVEPLVLDIENSLFSTLTLNITSKDLKETLSIIKKKWEELYPETPYSYSFLDEDFDMQYKYEIQVSRMINIIAMLGICIALIGLFGFVSFYIEAKTKEIGIRKVLGSSISGIVSYFSIKFVSLIMFTVVISFPIFWYSMKYWLNNFAYKVELTFFPLLLAIIIILCVSIITILSKCFNAANSNPVEALKYE